jgi:hypothetical protein
MDQSLDYLGQAAECRALARKARGEEHRERFIAIAEMWETLANDRRAARRPVRLSQPAE